MTKFIFHHNKPLHFQFYCIGGKRKYVIYILCNINQNNHHYTNCRSSRKVGFVSQLYPIGGRSCALLLSPAGYSSYRRVDSQMQELGSRLHRTRKVRGRTIGNGISQKEWIYGIQRLGTQTFGDGFGNQQWLLTLSQNGLKHLT